MSLTRSRFTIRGLLIAVAIASLLMGGARLLWLSSVYRRTANVHAVYEYLLGTLQSAAENDGKAERELLIAFGVEVEPDTEVVKAQRGAHARMIQKKVEYHAALKRKYMRAAARPWMAIDPDPPPPEPDFTHFPPGTQTGGKALPEPSSAQSNRRTSSV